MARRLLLFRWGSIGFVAIAILFTEHVCEPGRANWGWGYWVIVGAALWGVAGGYRIKRRLELKVENMKEKGLPAGRIARVRSAGSLISMAGASAVAYWGIVIRFILHSTRGQAILLHAGSVKSMPHLAIASRSLIPGAVLRHKIERGFINLSSPQKGSEEQASDYGSAPVSLTVLVVQYALGARAGRVVRAHVSQSSCPSS
jgi:hypothetical protein